ncbi:hypothetical protein E2C01_050724 [Portunus trituberculatus]|uniref:Uncharacterized protein n=1 Tax=Portunus trituberculatus TaxID=210409 RepID=A0A5B7GIA1_PORTR|nr:hypothetical protein [Portunus trituberculatus]
MLCGKTEVFGDRRGRVVEQDKKWSVRSREWSVVSGMVRCGGVVWLVKRLWCGEVLLVVVGYVAYVAVEWRSVEAAALWRVWLRQVTGCRER